MTAPKENAEQTKRPRNRQEPRLTTGLEQIKNKILDGDKVRAAPTGDVRRPSMQDQKRSRLRGAAVRIVGPIAVEPGDAEINIPIHADQAGIFGNRIIDWVPCPIID